MCVTPKILDGIAKSVERFFYVRAPVFSVKALCEFRPFMGITQFPTGGRKSKGAGAVKRGEACHEFPFEFIPQDPDRDKELTGRTAYLMVFRKSAAGDNAVHMDMV